AGIGGGLLYWRRGARAAGPRGPPTRPDRTAEREPPKKASKKPPEVPPEPELDALDEEIEKLLEP
ncbi:MAG: hypothetical protein R3291_02080, partial [Thermoplasmata archaeon]|nr:hypothetical protein [Thermoplasmata archaeon]